MREGCTTPLVVGVIVHGLSLSTDLVGLVVFEKLESARCGGGLSVVGTRIGEGGGDEVRGMLQQRSKSSSSLPSPMDVTCACLFCGGEERELCER
jgi:hypothetical protein